MSEALLSADIRERFDEMRHRLARLERSVSPSVDPTVDLRTKSPSQVNPKPLDDVALTERILKELSTDPADRPLARNVSVDTPHDQSDDPFAAIHARLVRKLHAIESARCSVRYSTSAPALSASPDKPASESSSARPATDGHSPLSAACTEPKSPSPCIDERFDTRREASPSTCAFTGHADKRRLSGASDSPLPVNPVGAHTDSNTDAAAPPQQSRQLFRPTAHDLHATHPRARSDTASHPRVAAASLDARTPTIRFSAEATLLEALTTAELMFLLRARGLIASDIETGDDPLRKDRCHTMFISPIEQAQLMRWRAAVASRVSSGQTHRARSSGASPPSASARRPSSASAHRPVPARSAFGRPVRASAPTASSLSKAKKTSYF